MKFWKELKEDYSKFDKVLMSIVSALLLMCVILLVVMFVKTGF